VVTRELLFRVGRGLGESGARRRIIKEVDSEIPSLIESHFAFPGSTSLGLSLYLRQAWIFQNDRANRHQRFLFKPITDMIIAG